MSQDGYYEDVADVDGDGVADDIQVTTHSDGSTEYLVDTDNDGTADYDVVDTDSDGNFESGTDTVAYDSDGDHTYDTYA